MDSVKSNNSKKSAVTAEPKQVSNGIKNLVLKPRISEKAYGLSEERNVFVFEVEPGANKFDIAKAVGVQYNVTAIKVRIAAVPGKATRSYRQRGRKSLQGQRSDIRKAYVTLKDGDKLPIFAAMEGPEPPKENK